MASSPPSSSQSIQLRLDAERIWRAGVQAVMPYNLISNCLSIEDQLLRIGDDRIDLQEINRIVVVGAGKAAGAMVVAIEKLLGQELLRKKRVVGWVNVPADCVVPTRAIHLHAARPAGINEPRPEAVAGTHKILKLVTSVEHDDLCLSVISGGGSALLAAPVPGISLDDKISVAQVVGAAGGSIIDLNIVRSQLSLVKGGGLAGACKVNRMFSLIISDVLSDCLDIVASGPTSPTPFTALDAIAVLKRLELNQHPKLNNVVRYLQIKARRVHRAQPANLAKNIVVGNNSIAVRAASAEALRLGYALRDDAAIEPEGSAEQVGLDLVKQADQMLNAAGRNCLISGGEPTVTLVDESIRGTGGRNQQLALAALAGLGDCKDIVVFAAGTDGEDGPTNAAGAVVTSEVVARARKLGLNPHDYLRRNDAYTFFAATEGLFKTGPTQTNVCDLRIVLTIGTEERQL